MTKNLLFVTAIVGSLAIGATSARAEEATQDAGASAQQEAGARPPRHHRGPKLTDEQKSCLEKILGKRGEGARPSHEKMHAAMQSCGVKPPPRRGVGPPPPPREADDGAAEE